MVTGWPLLTLWAQRGFRFPKAQTLTGYFLGFTRISPKVPGIFQKWNLSVVLNEFTKAPLEPIKDTDLKHLTVRIAFLLALTTGKWRNEIHAWVANQVPNLEQCEKVALFPFPVFIATKPTSKRFPSVSPLTIPARLPLWIDNSRRQDLGSATGPKALFGSKQRPKRNCFYFLQEKNTPQTLDLLHSLLD